MSTWLTVAEAARRAARSPQWVRDQIHAGRLSAESSPAGSRVRLLVEAESLDELVLSLHPRASQEATRTSPSYDSTWRDQASGVDDVVLLGLVADIDRAAARIEALEAEVRLLRIQRDAFATQARVANEALHEIGDAVMRP